MTDLFCDGDLVVSKALEFVEKLESICSIGHSYKHAIQKLISAYETMMLQHPLRIGDFICLENDLDPSLPYVAGHKELFYKGSTATVIARDWSAKKGYLITIKFIAKKEMLFPDISASNFKKLPVHFDSTQCADGEVFLESRYSESDI